MAEGRKFNFPPTMTDKEIERLGVLVSQVDLPVQPPLPRYMYGANDMDHMNLHELQALESNLENWVHNTRSTKMQIMSREIEVLKNKEGILKATNDILQERVF
ncbi:hypothetical protein ACQ4PT_009986 [Festuca glaucescens]